MRLWRRFHQGGNPLARTSDRFEGLLLLIVVVTMLGLIPFCLTIGSSSYAQHKSVADQQRSAQYPATATLLADGPAIAPGSEGTMANEAGPTAATWMLADGARRYGQVSADAGTPKGAVIPIWLDRAGDPVAAPESDSAALVYAVGLSVFLWLGISAALIGLFFLARVFLNAARYARWQYEWSQVEGRWSHR
jgi:hypothetical protein